MARGQGFRHRPLSLSWQRPLSFPGAHLNLQPGSLPSARYEPPLEAATPLRPPSNPRLPGVCWVPAALRPTTSHKASAGAVSFGREEVREEALVAKVRVVVITLPSSMGRVSRPPGALVAKPMSRFQCGRRRSGLRVSPNPSIERTCQGPLRAPCPAAHVERWAPAR